MARVEAGRQRAGQQQTGGNRRLPSLERDMRGRCVRTHSIRTTRRASQPHARAQSLATQHAHASAVTGSTAGQHRSPRLLPWLSLVDSHTDHIVLTDHAARERSSDAREQRRAMRCCSSVFHDVRTSRQRSRRERAWPPGESGSLVPRRGRTSTHQTTHVASMSGRGVEVAKPGRVREAALEPRVMNFTAPVLARRSSSRGLVEQGRVCMQNSGMNAQNAVVLRPATALPVIVAQRSAISREHN
jgi:hypothetical protein